MSGNTDAGSELLPGVKLKGLPDLVYLMVFSPEQPRIQWINTKAWIILELCRLRPASELAEAYAEAVAETTGRQEAERELQDTLSALLAQRIIRPVARPGTRVA